MRRVRTLVFPRDAMFNTHGMHVLDVRRGHRKLVITVGTDTGATGCRRCGVVAIGHGRQAVRAADAPCFGTPVLIVWLKRIWRCPELLARHRSLAPPKCLYRHDRKRRRPRGRADAVRRSGPVRLGEIRLLRIVKCDGQRGVVGI